MKFDHQKAFPYPVLRSDIDDYVDGEFQVTVDLIGSEDGTKLTANIHSALSVKETSERITAGEAEFVYVFACRETFYRSAISTTEQNLSYEFPAGNFKGEVIIYPFIMATKDINGFICKDINKEFGEQPFSFEKGEILAAETPRVLYVDRNLFRPVSSVFELVKSDAIAGNEWQLSFDQNNVRIEVSEEVKKKIDIVRNKKENRAILINSIYFSAVTAAINVLKVDKIFDDYTWARVIRQQCHNASIDINTHDAYAIAQKLLRYPLGLLLAHVFTEGD